MHEPLHAPLLNESVPTVPDVQAQAGALMALVGQLTSEQEGEPVQVPALQV